MFESCRGRFSDQNRCTRRGPRPSKGERAPRCVRRRRSIASMPHEAARRRPVPAQPRRTGLGARGLGVGRLALLRSDLALTHHSTASRLPRSLTQFFTDSKSDPRRVRHARTSDRRTRHGIAARLPARPRNTPTPSSSQALRGRARPGDDDRRRGGRLRDRARAAIELDIGDHHLGRSADIVVERRPRRRPAHARADRGRGRSRARRRHCHARRVGHRQRHRHGDQLGR